MKFIGIDIGTTSISGVVLDVNKRRIIAALNKDNASWIRTRHAWERIQNPAAIIRTAAYVLKQLTARYSNIAGIGVTGQMHGIVYSDVYGDAASPLFTWQDARAARPYRGTTYAGTLAKLSGHPVSPGFGMATHFYNIKNGIVPKNAASFSTIQDYVVMKLTGRTSPLIDATNAASFGIYDLKSLCFDRRAVTQAGISGAILPETAPSASCAGFCSGVPVYTALGDNQASFLGSVNDIAHTLLVNIGTGAQVSAYSRKYRIIDGLDTRPFPGGGYLLVGATLCGGKAYALLERFFRETLASFDRPVTSDLYAAMNGLDYASLVDMPNVDTRFAGTRSDPTIRGNITGITMDNFRPGHLVAGFLESMAAELYDFVLCMPPSLRRNISALTGSGNGLRKNPLLCRIIERRFGWRIRIPAHVEEAAVGAALYAAVGAGVLDFRSTGRMLAHETR